MSWDDRTYEKHRIEHGDRMKLLGTVDLRFDICRDIEQVIKIGRDFQNKDGYRGAHYDTVKLLCDAIEYQQEQLKTKTEVGDCAKLRDVLAKIRSEAYECDQGGEYLGEGPDPGFDRIVKMCDAALATNSSQKEEP